MSRKPQPEAAIRDREKYEKWLRFDPAVTAREALFTCGECGHAAHAMPGTAAWARPAQLWCCAGGAHVHRRNRACHKFTPERPAFNGLRLPNEEFENQLSMVQNSVFHIGDYATVRYMRHTPRHMEAGYLFQYELEHHAEPLAGTKTPIILEELWGWPLNTLEAHLRDLRAEWIATGYIRGSEIRREAQP